MVEKSESEKKDNIASGKPILSWEAPEFVIRKKEPAWFVVVGIIALILAAILYWQKLPSGSLVAIVAAVVLVILSGLHPRTIHCAIYQEGIVVDSKAYRYDQFKSFDIIMADMPKLKLDLIGKYSGEVTLPLKGTDTEEIKSVLLKHLPEENKGEDLLDRINRIMRF